MARLWLDRPFVIYYAESKNCRKNYIINCSHCAGLDLDFRILLDFRFHRFGIGGVSPLQYGRLS